MKSFPGQQWAFAGMTVIDALNLKWNECSADAPPRARSGLACAPQPA